MLKVKIAPSILSCDFAHLESEVRKVEGAGADYIHVDVMDGHFVRNISIGVPIVKSLRRITKLPLDVHMMVTDPLEYVDAFIEAGADILSVHVETLVKEKMKRKTPEGYTVVFSDDTVIDNQLFDRILGKIRAAGRKMCLAYNPPTMLEVADPQLIGQVDMLLAMSVWPGFGGQKFIDYTLGRIKNARETYPNIDIEIDGGINEENIGAASRSGANVFVAGTSIFKSKDPAAAVQLLRERAENHNDI